MKITENMLRKIIREESKEIISEGFNTDTGLPSDADGVIKTIENVMPKLAKSESISKQEYWTLYMLAQLVMQGGGGIIENVAKQLVRNNDSISKHL